MPHHIGRGSETIGAISVPDAKKAHSTSQANMPSAENGIDKVAISRTILRIIAHLEKVEYTDSRNERQADVVVHDDPPNPASDQNTTRG